MRAGYGIDLIKYLNKTSNFLESKNNLTSEQTAALIKCIDGDTAKFKVNDKLITVRFLAIDTPELTNSSYQDTYLGIEASNYTCNLLSKSSITLSYEKGIYNKDKYNRHLAWVYVDGKLIQEKLVQEGYAKVRYIYAKYTYTDKLLKLQQNAIKDRIGIWKTYQNIKYQGEYVVVFKIDNHTKSVDVSAGDIVHLINNPIKKGYTFVGWMKDGKLYDMSKPITSNVIVKASFMK